MAVASRLFTFAGLLAGVAALRCWRRLMETPEYRDPRRLPRIAHDTWIIRFGWAAPVSLPLLLLAT